VLINGTGDGFITRTRGLRQGYPMSAYLFIMAMEFLSRRLQKAELEGRIQGVCVAPTASNITHAMYADDLIILAHSTKAEVSELNQIMLEFGDCSGLKVNPEKSTI
jgi:Reverse transcriptase (RNA-dependent DNA polymerase)